MGARFGTRLFYSIDRNPTPIFTRYGIDPAMFGAILSIDMGGYTLATSLATNEAIGLLAGTTVASMIGCTIVFAIPVGIGLVEEKDYKFLRLR